MTQQQFNVTDEIKQMQQRRADRRMKKYNARSRLQDYQAELLAFVNHENGSYRLAAEWLATKKRLKVSHTTIMRFIKKLSAIQEANHGDKLP
jgi:hypothetical protein